MQYHLRLVYLVLWLSLSSLSLFAQQKYANIREALFASGQLTGSSGPASVNWIDGGERFSYIEGRGIIKSYDPKTDSSATIFDASEYKFPGSSDAFNYRSFQWSKDSQYLLFQSNFRAVWRNSGVSDYYMFSVKDKDLRLVAKDARTAELSPDGKMIAYEREGNLFAFELASKKEIQLTNDAQKDLYNGRFGWAYEEEFGLAQAWAWSPDSRFIAYWQSDEREVPEFQMTDYEGTHKEWVRLKYPQVGDKNPKVKIGIVEIASQKQQWVKQDFTEGYVPRIYWTANFGELAIVYLNRAQTELKLFFAQAKSGAARLVMEEKSEAWIDVFDFFAGIDHLFFFPKDRQEFFWISDRDGWSHIYRYDYKGKVLNQVTKGEWEVVYVHNVDSKAQTIYYSSTEASPLERQLYSINFNGKKKKQLSKAPGRHTVDFSPNSQYYLDTYSNVSTPKRVELWSTSGKMLKVMEENKAVAEFTKSGFSPRELEQFTTSDGQKLDIYIIKPFNFDESKQYPMVLNIYGGPGAQSVYNEFYSSSGSFGWEQYLAQEGFVVVSVNNRGSGGYGSKFEKCVYENLGNWESKDFVETAKYMAKKSWIDGDRMAIRGHSYGGYMSSYTMLKHPGVFQVAIVAAPVIDWRLYDSIYAERYMGLLPDNEEQYKSSASSTYAKNLDGKMLIVHSTMDENVHVQNTFQLVTALTNAGKDADLRIYPPGAHGVAYNLPSYVLLYGKYVDYLKAHLQK